MDDPVVDLGQAILKAQRELESSRPGVRCKDTTKVSVSKQTERVFTLYEFENIHTNEHHHYSLKIETFKKKDKKSWVIAPQSTVSLSGENGELAALERFLAAARSADAPQASGVYLIVPNSGMPTRLSFAIYSMRPRRIRGPMCS